MTLIEELKSLGANVDEGLDRVMGDHDLYEMMLGMFISSVGDNPISTDEFDSADLDGLIKKVHMLKGVTGNLALTPLFNSYTEILGQLRAGQAKDAKKGYETLLGVQKLVLDCIQRNQTA